MSDRVSIGAVLRAARQAAGLTQEALSRACGVGYTTLSQIERGRRPLPEEALARLPEPVRSDVIVAMIREHEAEIRRLRALLRAVS
jgi:transcriptional regulator with XRE-family HTH domain